MTWSTNFFQGEKISSTLANEKKICALCLRFLTFHTSLPNRIPTFTSFSSDWESGIVNSRVPRSGWSGISSAEGRRSVSGERYRWDRLLHLARTGRTERLMRSADIAATFQKRRSPEDRISALFTAVTRSKRSKWSLRVEKKRTRSWWVKRERGKWTSFWTLRATS